MGTGGTATLGPMFDSPRPAVVVALPGTGSDAHFAHRAFGPASAAAGIDFVAVDPDPAAVIESYRAALDDAATRGPVLAAGISLGAAVAVEWAAGRKPGEVGGVVAALPAWTGPDTAECPATHSAAATAAQLRAEGLDTVIDRMRASSPGWLADALARSWRSQWPGLPTALEEAAQYKWPEPALLDSLSVPLAVIAASDDPVHPVAVGREWAHRAPRSALTEVTLDQFGADPGIVGRLALRHFG